MSALKASVDTLRQQLDSLAAANAAEAGKLRGSLQTDLNTLASRSNQLVLGLVVLFVLLGLLLLSTSS